jgi:hypothetical protein
MLPETDEEAREVIKELLDQLAAARAEIEARQRFCSGLAKFIEGIAILFPSAATLLVEANL